MMGLAVRGCPPHCLMPPTASHGTLQRLHQLTKHRIFTGPGFQVPPGLPG